MSWESRRTAVVRVMRREVHRVSRREHPFFSSLVNEYCLNSRNHPVCDKDIDGFSRASSLISSRYNKLLNMIHTSLQELLKAMKGLVVLSQALEEMSKSLFNNAVPVMWSKVVCWALESSLIFAFTQRCFPSSGLSKLETSRFVGPGFNSTCGVRPRMGRSRRSHRLLD